jgi:hypothetical protein
LLEVFLEGCLQSARRAINECQAVDCSSISKSGLASSERWALLNAIVLLRPQQSCESRRALVPNHETTWNHPTLDLPWHSPNLHAFPPSELALSLSSGFESFDL